MAFHAVRFPLDIALGARGGPERATDVVMLASGREERNSRWAHSRRRYNAGYGVKSRADMQAVLAFFEERRGRFHSFLWRDALDHSASGQVIGEGDTEIDAFQLVKTYGADFDPYLRPITKPVAETVAVLVDDEPVVFAVDALWRHGPTKRCWPVRTGWPLRRTPAGRSSASPRPNWSHRRSTS